jgi:PAS domain S-box-containing protein
MRLGDGSLENANQQMADIFGYADLSEFVKEYVLTKRFVDPGTQQKMFADFKNGDLKQFETRCYRKDGSTVWVLISARLSPVQGIVEGVVTDISGLKRLEDDLQKSEEKYRVLVEQQLGRSLLYAMERNRLKQDLLRERELTEKVIKSSEDGVLAFDRSFHLTMWNSGMEAITGFSKNKMLNRNLFGVLPVFKEMHETRKVFNGGPARQILDSSQPMRLSPLSPEGYYDGHFFPLRNEGGEVIGGLIVIRNLTDLRKAEAALEEKDRLLVSFFNTLRDGVLFLNQDFTILKANPIMQEWYAHEKPLAGKKCYAVLHGRSRPCETCPASQAKPTGEVHHEVIARRGPEGETVGWLDLSAYPLMDQKSGKFVGLIERAADISEQHHQEEALKEAEERYRRITESIPLIRARIFSDGAIEFFDDKIEKLTGYTREEFASRSLTWPEVVVEEDRNLRRQGMAQTSKDDSSYGIEYRIKTKAGEILWLRESGHITLAPNGKFDHSDIVLFDITERKQNEEITPKLEAQLRQAQRMEAIGTLAGGIAHDFNNILGVMLGYAEMALYSLQEDSDLKRKLQQILKAGQRGKDLVSQILAFSRPGKPERKLTKVSIIIKETLRMLRATMPTTVELNLEVEEDNDAVEADPTQIHQVLLNLCANAAHAMREKGGILEVSLHPLDLDEATAAQYHDLSPGPYIRVIVKDSGHGMDKEVMERIFDPFFTTKSPGEGTGMGLAVAHSIVKAHGGVITVQSEPGVGTEFQVLLPRIHGTPPPGVKERSRMDKGQGNILFVDDEEWLVEMWQEILENMGYDVYPHTVSQEALEAFRAEPGKFDLVITDQTMPQMTGFNMAAEMLKIRRDLPVVLCTGYSEVVTPEKAKAAGIREYVMKPLSISELTGAIRRALGTESAAIKA